MSTTKATPKTVADAQHYELETVTGGTLVFEPLADGEHMRIEYTRCGDQWVPVGREPVEDVGLETADGVMEGR